MKKAIKGKVGFAIGTGRCGTHFIAEILKNEKSIAIYHERYPLLESFERFVQWYNLPIDHEGFLNTLETEIKKDLIHKDFYFESSSYLSFSIEELYKRFDAKFIFLVRAPHEVINSYITKGLYKFPYIQKDYEKALGYQKSEKFHHYFSRLAPKGQEFFEWNHKTRVGKLAWFWREFNKEVLKRLKNIPESNWKLIKIEEWVKPQKILYDCIAETSGMEILVDASKIWQRLYLLKKSGEFNIKVIHLVRDGRGVLNSYITKYQDFKIGYKRWLKLLYGLFMLVGYLSKRTGCN